MNKKMYNKPVVEAMQLQSTANLLAGSDILPVSPTPIPGGGD